MRNAFQQIIDQMAMNWWLKSLRQEPEKKLLGVMQKLTNKIEASERGLEENLSVATESAREMGTSAEAVDPTAVKGAGPGKLNLSSQAGFVTMGGPASTATKRQSNAQIDSLWDRWLYDQEKKFCLSVLVCTNLGASPSDKQRRGEYGGYIKKDLEEFKRKSQHLGTVLCGRGLMGIDQHEAGKALNKKMAEVLERLTEFHEHLMFPGRYEYPKSMPKSAFAYRVHMSVSALKGPSFLKGFCIRFPEYKEYIALKDLINPRDNWCFTGVIPTQLVESVVRAMGLKDKGSNELSAWSNSQSKKYGQSQEDIETTPADSMLLDMESFRERQALSDTSKASMGSKSIWLVSEVKEKKMGK